MKRNTDPRHKERQEIVKRLFTHGFKPISPKEGKLKSIISNIEQIDEFVSINAPEWPLSQINRVDLAILRLALYELSNTNTPPKVVIDEAVELAKEYGSNSSAKFVNGVLGSYLKRINKQSQ